MSGGRRISAQRQLLRGGARYDVPQRPHTTTVQSGPVWKKILSPLQMDTPYEIFAKIPREPEKIRDATTTSSRARAAPGRPHSAPKNSWRDSPSSYYSGPNLGLRNCENERSRAENAFSKIIEVVVPYELPNSWEWRGHLLRQAGAPRSRRRLHPESLLPHCDRCLTGAPALGFVHPHVEWKAEHAFWAPKGTKVQYGSNLP